MSVPLRQRSARPSAALLPPAYSAPGLDIAIEEEKGIFYRASSATPTSSRFKTVLLSSLLTAASLGAFYLLAFPFPTPTPTPVPRHVARGLNLCKSHDKVYGPPSDFADRKTSDRFVPGTKPVLLTNATIWTGGEDGHEVIAGGEILLDQGIVKFVGQKAEAGLLEALKEYVHVDVKGQWVTPGIVDMHSHAGVDALPGLGGANDGNSLVSNTNPQLRSLDGFNSHDLNFKTITAGGTTTSLVLPGSADSIGGQAYVFKFRQAVDNDVTSMLVEPPFAVDATGNWTRTNHMRHMKHAFGENPSRVWGQTRMDSQWDLRSIYEQARLVKVAQDEWCESAQAGETAGLGRYPESPLKLEALVDTLRGNVLVNAHCYEGTDIDALVRLSNEFQFRFAALHHAHETHLVPNLLKRMWKGPPGAAIFASFSRYKREAYRHSVHAAKILSDAGIPVAMKSDHSAIDSRYLLHEAVSAHHYGLEANRALQSVTSTPADLMGKGHRIGYLKKGVDADVVIWQSHPLALGATPAQVYVDGIPQLDTPHLVPRSPVDQTLPTAPDYSKEIADVISSRGDTEMEPTERAARVVFVNVDSVVLRDGASLKEHIDPALVVPEGGQSVVVEDGEIVCSGACGVHVASSTTKIVDLEGGAISPGLTVYGVGVGLAHIDMEESTTDAGVDVFVPGKAPTTVRYASDALVFGTKNEHVGLRAGVTHAISPPASGAVSDNVFKGFNVFHSLSASHRLAPGAVLSNQAGLSIALGHSGTPISAQIAVLREVLTEKVEEGKRNAFQVAVAGVTEGDAPLVVAVDNADQIATLLEVKREAEKAHGRHLNVVLYGAKEGHLLADELAAAKFGVIVAPVRGQPLDWDSRRVLPGVPLTRETVLSTLKKAGVNVAVGFRGDEPPFASAVGTTRWALAFTLTDSVNSPFSTLDALSLATTSLEALLHVEVDGKRDWVAVRGGKSLLDVEGKVVAVSTGTEVLLF